MHKGIKTRRKVSIYLINRRRWSNIDRYTNWNPLMKSSINNYYPQTQRNNNLLSELESTENVNDDHVRLDKVHADQNRDDDGDDEILFNTSGGGGGGFSHKYQPRRFQDIVGQEITIKAISSAAEKKKTVHLYLFHGPSGTGKTSTAKIFAMALNCESTSSSTKPCWGCRGCTRSICIMDLCSGRDRIAGGFKKIKTLLQRTSLMQAVPGFKVLIIEECHSFTARAWDELLGMLQLGTYGSTVIFVLITVDATMIPSNIFSRCQKFCFTKLNDKDITLKLARIIACENIEIEREAWKLVITKAQGSLREAENILDQLALLGSPITSSMVQQLVGLVPHNKLVDLLATAISGDTIRTIRFTRELIATGVESQALLSQLASLITDILSVTVVADPSSSAGALRDKRLLRSRSQFTNNIQPEGLCNALKILVESEKQMTRSSTDKSSSLVAALLEITALDVGNTISTGSLFPSYITLHSADEIKSNPSSEDIHWQRLSHSRSSRDHQSIFKPSKKRLNIDKLEPSTTSKGLDINRNCRGKQVEKEPKSAPLSDMEEIWQNMLERMKSKSIKEFLCHKVKLESLTVSNANAIVHLLFKTTEDKMAAQMSGNSISKALKRAIGCPVTVNMSLAPFDLVICEENTLSTQEPLSDCTHSKPPQRTPFVPEIGISKTSEAATCSNTAQKSFPISDSSRPTKIKAWTPTQEPFGFPSEEKETGTDLTQKNLHFLGLLTPKNQFDMSAHPERGSLTRELNSGDMSHIMTTNTPKHRWLSLSSIPQSDASVEPYSQDILFETANRETESKVRKKATEVHNSQETAMSSRKMDARKMKRSKEITKKKIKLAFNAMSIRQSMSCNWCTDYNVILWRTSFNKILDRLAKKKPL